MYLSLDELSRQLDIMDQLVQRETPAQREAWRRKILELREEASSLQRQGQYYHRMVSANVRVQKEREELLTRRRRRKGAGSTDAESGMQDLADESESLANSQNMVGELLMSGQAQLNSLYDQRKRMKGVKRTVLNIGNKLGLSNATMKMIEKRDEQDLYLVLGGMVLTSFIIYVVYFR